MDKLWRRYVGGILLVTGTTIGAGMLALPVGTAAVGFFPSLVVFVLAWLLMLATAFFFLDVNLSIKGESNLISMAHKTLGQWGKALGWIVYLLLLYSLVAAYISASAPLFRAVFDVPPWLSYFFLPVLFGSFVYLGTGGVDVINRLLMIGLAVSFLLMVFLIPSHVEPTFLLRTNWQPLYLTVPLVITSFGYHIIIPSLSTYMKHDRKHLVLTLVIGSIVPLILYLLWQVLVLGAVPYPSLQAAWVEGSSATGPLAAIVQSKTLARAASFFAFFAIVTSFLGVSLSLSDFLIDGFRIKKSWEGRLLALLMVFVPPLIFVFASARGFILALEYAGAFVALLLIFLPSAMAWHLPAYRKKKPLLALCIVASFVIVGLTVAVTR